MKGPSYADWEGCLPPTPVPAFAFDKKKNSVIGSFFNAQLQNPWGPASNQLNQRKRQESGEGEPLEEKYLCIFLWI